MRVQAAGGRHGYRAHPPILTSRTADRIAAHGVRSPLLVAGLLAAATVYAAAVHAQEDVPVVEGGSGDLEARVTRIERSIQGRGLLDLANQVEALQREVQRLRGELEQQQHVIDELSARQGKGLARLDQRVQALEGGRALNPDAPAVAPLATPPLAAATETPAAGVSPGTEPAPPLQQAAVPQTPPAPGATPTPPPAAESPAAPGTAPATQTAHAAPAATPGDPDQAYSAAFNALKAGKYDDAIAQFNNFLVTYPDNPRADSAQYWLGEAYYVNKQFNPAITEYQKLVAAYPTSQKVSQAMLKIGFCQQELGQREAAAATLQQVVQRYPGTTSARMAEDRLQRMRLEQSP